MKKTLVLAMALVASRLAFGQEIEYKDWITTEMGMELAFGLNDKQEPLLYIWQDAGIIQPGDTVFLFFNVPEDYTQAGGQFYIWDETMDTSQSALTLVLHPDSKEELERYGLEMILIKDDVWGFDETDRVTMRLMSRLTYR